ncbi:hypothetical protein V6N11_083262 [Hibiscus sabdariffa]|uniref:Uncharacterized protein n=1 Tax=Hibiscus sabdariffa TaxID=183260 RepID=A0ABR2QLR5_9ROSI
MRHPKMNAKSDLMAYAMAMSENIDTSQEPSTYSEVVGDEDSSEWMLVMQEGMKSPITDKFEQSLNLVKS